MQSLKNKNSKEKANIKSSEITKIDFVGSYNRKDLKIEITKIEKIDGGISVFARAWKKEKQLGFGKVGNVDIERFRIFNPPVLVDDENGEIIREWKEESGEVKQRKLKFDPQEAIIQTLEHTIGLVGKENTKIIKGKVGNTTSTFYPDASPETNSFDGLAVRQAVNETWSTIISGAGNFSLSTDTTLNIAYFLASSTTNQWERLHRSILTFDTSSLPDTDNIDSAILSLYGQNKADGNSATPNTNIYGATPASDNAIVDSDYGQTQDVEFSTSISYGSFSTSAYNDFSLNSSGLSNITKTGVSKFSAKNPNYDVADSDPNWVSGQTSFLRCYSADQTGTANDPKLVVEHTTAPTTISITKSLKYTILKEIAITKSLNYEVVSGVAIQKSLKYTVIQTPTQITRGLIYAVVKETAIMKSLQYEIESQVAITKSLKYTIKQTPTQITKSLEYQIFVETAVQKSLRYEILTEINIQKSLSYEVESQVAINKILEYTILTDSVIQKSLRYAIVTTPTAIQKGLQYEIITDTSIQKSLRYEILTDTEIQKSLRYAIVNCCNSNQKTLTYQIESQTAVQKSLKYTITIVATAIQKSLTYRLTKETIVIQKSLNYEVVTKGSITKSLIYNLVIENPITKSLQYEVRKFPYAYGDIQAYKPFY